MTNEETIGHLNQLVAVSRDGEQGYRRAVDAVSEQHLRSVFGELASQRAGFVRDLAAEIERLGGAATESGTLEAAVHRGWISLKSALTGGGAEAIVAACETGEDSAAATYERVVNTDISGQPRALVERQWKQVKEAHQRMLHLKKELA